MSVVDAERPCSFEHEAFIYDDDAEYVAVLGAAIADAVAAGTPVIAVTSSPNQARLRHSLAATAAAVRWVDAARWYVHPVRTIAAYEATLRRLDPDVGALVIGEVQFGETADSRAAWSRYEAALNEALSRYRARVICPYDSRALSADVVDDARRTHPHLVDGDGRVESDSYVAPGDVAAERAPDVPLPSRRADLDLPFGPKLRALRHAFTDIASTVLDRARVEDLTLAVGEVASNAVEHGGGGGRLRVWATAGAGVVVAVDDNGSGVDDPLLGFRPPPPGAPRGYGMWITRRLFDRVELRSGPSGGLSVHLVADA